MLTVNEASFTVTSSKTTTIPMEHIDQLKVYRRRCGSILYPRELADTYNIALDDAVKILSHLDYETVFK